MITISEFAFGAAAVLTIAIAGEYPTFQAQVETTWTKTFTEKSSFTVDSMLQTLDGQEVQSSELDMDGVTTREVVVVDEVEAAEDGRATKVRRVFDTIESRSEMSLSSMGMTDEHELSLTGHLTGVGLRCDWSDGEYEFGFEVEEEGESAWLEDLSEDTDYKFLLPDEEIEEGDSWVVDLSEGQDLLAPGGQLTMNVEEVPAGPFNLLEREDVILAAMISLAEQCEGMEGEATATWSETRKDGDRRLAVIDLELEVELEADLADELVELLASGDFEEREELIFEVLSTLEGEGELLWDLDANHFRSLELKCETTYEIAIAWVMPFGEIALEIEASGECKLGAEAEEE